MACFKACWRFMCSQGEFGELCTGSTCPFNCYGDEITALTASPDTPDSVVQLGSHKEGGSAAMVS